LTLYRFPIEELDNRGFTEGEVPYLEEGEEASFPEEIVFSLKDIKELYRSFAFKDERIKDFIEKLTDMVTT
jgi:hypothetical protein